MRESAADQIAVFLLLIYASTDFVPVDRISYISFVGIRKFILIEIIPVFQRMLENRACNPIVGCYPGTAPWINIRLILALV
jgi:hypothetical protein